MLRRWRRRPLGSATSNLRTSRSSRRSVCSISAPQDAAAAAEAHRSSALRVGVLGLGAIGTIFFTRLGLLAADSTIEYKLPTLQVEALVKPAQFDLWTRTTKLRFSLEGEKRETLEFQMHSKKRMATVRNAPNVRVCTLESTREDEGENKVDILLVAVKAYDSVGMIRELRERSRHLLKHDALCVLLQNGLGEVPQEEDERGMKDPWQFMSGVTFSGGRVRRFGRVVTSGLNAGKTYLAPLKEPVVRNEVHITSDDKLLRRERDAKMEMLARIFVAAGIDCKVLDADEMQAVLWRKLIVNAAINPLASLFDAPNRSVASENSRRCVNLVVQEALAVANCENILLDCSHNELVEDVLDVARNTGANVCSMLMDLRRGSRTEINAITGRIVADGKRHGVPTPTNDLLLSLIKALEEEGTRRSSASSVHDAGE